MQDTLDNANVIAQRDPFGALGVAAKEWEQMSEEYEIVGDIKKGEFRTLVVAGMGGSALAPGLAKDWLNLGLPFEVIKGYTLPKYVDEHTLVIASSYSGNTEETVSALQDALSRKATVAVIASGGKLIDIAKESHLPYILQPAGIQPRMAAISSLMTLLTLLEEFGVIAGRVDEVRKIAPWIKDESSRWEASVPTDFNFAKQLAIKATGKTPVIYASNLMRGVAYKWKISFNENAKNTAFWNELPEFNHNEFIGWSSHPIEKPFVIYDLRSSFEHPQISKRFEVTDRLLSGKRPKAEVIELEGDSVVAQMLWGCVLADFVSIYLAILSGVEPTKVDLVEKLKTEL